MPPSGDIKDPQRIIAVLLQLVFILLLQFLLPLLHLLLLCLQKYTIFYYRPSQIAVTAQRMNEKPTWSDRSSPAKKKNSTLYVNCKAIVQLDSEYKMYIKWKREAPPPCRRRLVDLFIQIQEPLFTTPPQLLFNTGGIVAWPTPLCCWLKNSESGWMTTAAKRNGKLHHHRRAAKWKRKRETDWDWIDRRVLLLSCHYYYFVVVPLFKVAAIMRVTYGITIGLIHIVALIRCLSKVLDATTGRNQIALENQNFCF